MSSNIAMLRDALAAITAAAIEFDAPHSDALTRAIARALAAHNATRFVAPGTFPAVVSTRSGADVTLHALHDGRLIGSYVDRDGLQSFDWNADGTMFSAADPDDFDLVLPDEMPARAPAARASHDGVVVIPFLGRVS
jgi:hypothetical protein